MTGTVVPLEASAVSLAESILLVLGRRGDATAVSDGAVSLSYSTLASEVKKRRSDYNALAAASGRPILLVLDQSVSAVVDLLAAVLSDCVPCIADPTWNNVTISDICQTYNVGSVVVSKSSGRLYPVKVPEANLCPVRAETAFVRFSSGSSGLPKAIEFGLDAMVIAAQRWSAAVGYYDEDRVFCLATLNNGLAFNTSLLAVFLAGAELYLHNAFITPSSVLGRMARVSPHYLVGFPFMWQLMLSRAHALVPSLGCCRSVLSSAAPLQHSIIERWLTATGLPIGHYYGIAETGPITFNDGSSPSSVGRPLPDVELKFVDVEPAARFQEIRVRTGTEALGYLAENDNERNLSLDEDGFYRTRDLGSVDDAGSLYISGRADRVANYHGKKFSLSHVERVIGGMTGVSNVHVAYDPSSKIKFNVFVESNQLTRDNIYLLRSNSSFLANFFMDYYHSRISEVGIRKIAVQFSVE